MIKHLQKIPSYWELTKPTITGLVLVTTFIGFYLALQEMNASLVQNGWLLFHTLFGSAFVSGGVGALNEYFERHLDSRMHRTRSRPLPSGRLSSREALVFGIFISLFGITYLALTVNMTTSLLSFLTLALYLFVYTPLKSRTTLNTLVGAIPGALPPVGGWVAAGGDIAPTAWLLFGIMFLWQVPHFLSIAWIYRKDYSRAGFKMLPSFDQKGIWTAVHIITFSTALLICSLGLYYWGATHGFYLVGAALLGVAFLAIGINTSINLSNTSARRLLFASIIYLPILLGLIIIDQKIFL